MLKHLAAILLVLYALLIAWLSLREPDSVEIWFAYQDKVYHFIAYLVFAAISAPLLVSRRAAFGILIGIFAYSMLMEALQGLTASREPSFADLAANLAGVSIGVMSLRMSHSRLAGWLGRFGTGNAHGVKRAEESSGEDLACLATNPPGSPGPCGPDTKASH